MSFIEVIAGVAGATKVVQGFLGQRAASRQADAVKGEARAAQAELIENAAFERDEAKRRASRQSLAFLKNGVTLAGSPLLTTQATIDEGERQASALELRGQNIRKRASQSTEILRKQGRNAILGGFGGALTAVAGGKLLKKLRTSDTGTGE